MACFPQAGHVRTVESRGWLASAKDLESFIGKPVFYRQISKIGGPSCRPIYAQISIMKRRIQNFILTKGEHGIKNKWVEVAISYEARDALRQWISFLEAGIPLVNIVQMTMIRAFVDAAQDEGCPWGMG